MEKIYFLTLCPDDYHGAPQILEFTNEDFPLPVGEDIIFEMWCAAGYNSYQMGDFGSEEEAFDLYGNNPCYYATYMINFSSSLADERIRNIIENEITEAANELLMGESLLDVNDVCEVIKKISGVVNVFPLEFGDVEF